MQIDLTSVRWKETGLYCAIVVLLFCLSSKCEREREQLANVKALTSELSSYKLKNGQLVASKEALVYTNKELREKILDKDATLKEMAKKIAVVQTVTRYKNTVRVDTVNVVYKDSIPCVFERSGSVATKDYSLKYKTTQKGVTISELYLENYVTILTGTKRKWFLGKETQTISITNSNRLVSTEELEYIEVKKAKRFYDTNLFKIGLGFVGGILIAR